MRNRLLGVLALVGIVVFLVGVPVGLLAVSGSPVPASIPSWDQVSAALTRPDDGQLILGVLRVLAWAGWAYFAASLVVEIAAQVRRVPTPRLPGLNGGQVAAAGLVSTAALVFAAPAAFAAAPAPAGEMSAPAVSSTVAATDHDQKERGKRADRYVVERGDTLWEIADEELGNPRKFPSIVDASRGIQQPDGNRLTDPDHIEPGWSLRIPDTNTHAPVQDRPSHRNGVGNVTGSVESRSYTDGQNAPGAKEGPSKEPQSQKASSTTRDDQQPAPTKKKKSVAGAEKSAAETPVREKKPAAEATTPTPSPTAKEVAPPVASPAAASVTPTPTPTAPPAEAFAPQATQPTEEAAEEAFPIRTATGVGSLLAAGVIGLLAWRRRMQHRRRGVGQPLPMPVGDAAITEAELRQVADPFTVEQVDLALRSLAQHCHTAGAPLPQLRVARLTVDQLELHLEFPAALPEPWAGTADQGVWTLTLQDLEYLDPVGETAAPYPALVTIGHDETDSHVMIDLEQVATLGVDADPETVQQIMTALTVELATSRWADDLQVSVVGHLAELDDILQTGRIAYVPTATLLLQDLATKIAADRAALVDADMELASARPAGQLEALWWAPQIVMVPDGLPAEQGQELLDLLEGEPRVAAAVVTGSAADGQWRLEVIDADQAILHPVGWTLSPQTIDEATYNDLLSLIVTADPQDMPDPAPGIGLADVPEHPHEPAPERDEAAAVPVDVEPSDDDLVGPSLPAASPSLTDVIDLRTTTGPKIQLLGPVKVLDAPGSPANRERRLTEIVAYLHLHPGRSKESVNEALWPDRRVATSTRNSYMSRARRWVGCGGDDPYSLGEGLTSDWQEWCRLLPDGPAEASLAHLQAAVSLIRGRPFADIPPMAYGWAEPLIQQMICATTDACAFLAQGHLLAGKWRAAEEAAVIGISIDPTLDVFWRTRIMAAHRSGNDAAAQEAISRLVAYADRLDFELDPETAALLEELSASVS